MATGNDVRRKRLPRSFYLRPTLVVARELLGKHIVRTVGKSRLIGKIVETEAYCEGDPASHSFRGRTARNDVMFWKGGHLYVYFTYGMHYCANVVTRPEGTGEAVLIRAVEPVSGIRVMRRKRFGGNPGRAGAHNAPFNLTNGPAKFCQAFGIDRKSNGRDLLEGGITILDAPPIPSSEVLQTGRIGIVRGKSKKWRFYARTSRWVSRKAK